MTRSWICTLRGLSDKLLKTLKDEAVGDTVALQWSQKSLSVWAHRVAKILRWERFRQYKEKVGMQAEMIAFQLEMAKAMSNNTKMFFSGDNSPLGAIFAKIFAQGQ